MYNIENNAKCRKARLSRIILKGQLREKGPSTKENRGRDEVTDPKANNVVNTFLFMMMKRTHKIEKSLLRLFHASGNSL